MFGMGRNLASCIVHKSVTNEYRQLNLRETLSWTVNITWVRVTTCTRANTPTRWYQGGNTPQRYQRGIPPQWYQGGYPHSGTRGGYPHSCTGGGVDGFPKVFTLLRHRKNKFTFSRKPWACSSRLHFSFFVMASSDVIRAPILDLPSWILHLSKSQKIENRCKV